MSEFDKKLEEILYAENEDTELEFHEERVVQLKALFASEWERMVKEARPRVPSFCSAHKNPDISCKVCCERLIKRAYLDHYESKLTQKLAKLMEEEK